jgi:hypothetical protein
MEGISMSSSRLVRWSGLALLLAGILIAVSALLHPSDADPRAALSSAWVPVHIMFTAGAVLTLFGLIGFYGAQADAAGRLGLIGFILTFTGNSLVVALLMLEAFVIPALAADAAGQALLDPAGPLFGGALGIALLLMAASFALGSILLGIATARAGALPRLAGVLLIAGGPLLALWPPLPQIVGTAGAVLLGASFVWSGYVLWSRPAARSLQAKAAI